MHKERYKEKIAAYLSVSPADIFLFWKGRVALYALLKAFGIKEEDEVILPAFTCVVVPNAIIYLGAKPVYVDIDPLTYNMDVAKMENAITPRTKVILAQNTFGLSPDLNAISEVAKKYNIRIIEDCTHGFGGTYKGRKNGTIADASFFSTQWNKPFSTGIGGIAYTNNPTIAGQMRSLEKACIKPSFSEVLQLRLFLIVRNWMFTPSLYWPLVKTYRLLSRKNIIVGSSQGKELDAPVPIKGFIKNMSELQARKGVHAIKNVDADIRHRIHVAKQYNTFLPELGVRPPYEPEYAEHTFLKYPLLVKDRMAFLKLAEKEKIQIGDWFLSPIHPIKDRYEMWQYTLGSNPVAEFVAAHIINLPTGTDIIDAEIQHIRSFLQKNKEMLLENDGRGSK